MPQLKTATKVEPIELVKDAYERGNHDVGTAVEILYREVLSDQSFIAEQLPKMVRTWCDEAVRDYVASVRKKSFYTAPPSGLPSQNRERLSNAITYGLLDFPLPKGKRLGDASPEEVFEASYYYDSVERDAGWKKRWLASVAKAAGRARKIENALSEADLERLREEADAE